jgi:hypothetical protein
MYMSSAVGASFGANGELIVTVDLSGLAPRPAGLVINFDLIGLNAVDSEVSVDSLRLLGATQNAAPTATGETVTTPEDTPILIDILANDSDPDGDPLIVQIETDLGQATLLPVSGGLFRYTPAPNVTGSHEITYRVFDGVSRSDPAVLTVNISPLNDAPEIDAIPDARVPQGREATVQVNVSDIDNDRADLVLSLDAAPAGATIDSATGVIRWTPTAPGAETFTVRVTDPDGGFATTSFTLTVQQPPVLTVTDTALLAGTALSHAVTASDPDGDDAQLVFALTGAVPAWINIDPATGTLTGDTTGQAGRYLLTMQVTDSDGLTTSEALTVTVYGTPVITASNVVLIEGDPLAATPLATDPDSPDSELTFAKTSGPDWITVNATTGEATGQTTDNVGVFTVGVSVTDAQGLTDDTTFTVTVRARPQISVADVSVTQGTALNHPVTASDEDSPANSLVFAKLSGPDWIMVDPATGAVTGDSTGQAGPANVTISVTDPDGLGAQATFVVDVNVPPAISLANTTVVEGAAVNVQPVLTDPDNADGTARYSKLSGPAWISVDPATGAVTGDSAGGVGAHVVQVQVTDADGLTGRASFTLTVLARPQISVADAVLTVGDALSLAPSVTDPDSPAAQLTFAKLAGPDWIMVDRATGAITGDSTGQAGLASITVSVTDAEGLSDQATFTVDVNAPPSLTAADQTLEEGQQLDLTLTVADPDNPGETPSFRIVSGPAWIILTDSGQIVGDTTGQVGIETVTIEATDSEGLTGQTTFRVTVQARPVLTVMDTRLVEGDSLSLAVAVTDQDSPAASLTFAKQAGPDWISIDPSTGALSGASAGQVGRHTVTISVVDSDGLSDTATIIVTVLARPVLTASDVTLIEGQALDLQLIGADADTATADLRYAVVTAPAWMQVDAISGRVTGATTGNSGVHSATFRVTDPDGLSAEFTVQVDVNARPTLSARNITVVRGERLSHGVTATDADTPIRDLVFRLLAGPDWISVDRATGRLTGDTSRQAGEALVRISVTDADGLRAETTLTVDVNAPPRIDDQQFSLASGQPILANMITTDPDTQIGALRYSLVSGPDWLTLDPGNGRLEGVTTGRSGTVEAVIRVTDTDGLSDDATLTFTIQAPPTPVVAAVTPPTLTRPLGSDPLPLVGAPEISLVRLGQSGELPGGRTRLIPVLFQSNGGIRQMVIEATHQLGQRWMLDALAGLDLPVGVSVNSEVIDRDGVEVLRISIHSDEALPEGALDLLRLRVLQGTNPDLAGLTIRAVEINGQAVDQDIPTETDSADSGGGGAVDLDGGLASDRIDDAQLHDRYDITLNGFGADNPGARLIDPEALPDGRMALHMQGLSGADTVSLRFAYDGDALMPQDVLSDLEGASVTLNTDADAGEFELTIADIPALMAEVAMLAAIAFARPPQGRRTGALALRELRIDGADVPIDEEGLSDWTAANPHSYSMASGSHGGLSVPMVHAPVRAPEK